MILASGPAETVPGSAAPGPGAQAPACKPVSISFGHPEWQTHLGGDFRGIESAGEVSWNWAGAGECWCVLPLLEPDTGYSVRLEAAPLAPFSADLRELEVLCGGARLLRRVAACGADETAMDIPLSLEELARRHPLARLELVWRRLPPPTLSVRANDLPVAELVFETRPDMQFRDFALRRKLLAAAPETVLFFKPNIAVSKRDLEGSGEDRLLSFRLFRLILTPE